MAVQTIPARLRWAVDFIDVQPQDHILEIGCGSGQAADLICRRLEGRGKLFAIDRSEAGVDRTEAEVIEERLSAPELLESWAVLSDDEKVEGFRTLRRPEREDFFLELPSRDQATLVEHLPPEQRRSWLRLLAPDDAADVIQHVAPEERESWLALLDPVTRRDVSALLAYGAANFAQDFWHEQVVKRGWTEHDIPSVTTPRVAAVWVLVVAGTALAYTLGFARGAERVEPAIIS